MTGLLERVQPWGRDRLHSSALLLILLVALGFRLWGITNPLLDFHSWRQTDTASIARNFYKERMNILRPRLDVLPGYEELGFPLYPYLVATLYKLCGVREWLGRVLSVFFALASLTLLHRLAKKYYPDFVAHGAALYVAVLPVSVYYTRTFQPEAAMLFFSIGAIYYFSRWTDTDSWLSFSVAVGCLALALLIKIPTLYLGFPLLLLAWLKHGRRIVYDWRLYLFAFLSLGPALLWYWYDHQVVMRHGGGISMWAIGQDKWANREILTSPEFYRHIFATRVAERMFALTGVPFFVIGLFCPVERKEQYLFHAWLAGVVIYFLVVARGNYVHEYYQLPIIPVGAVFIARGLHAYFREPRWARFRRHWVTAIAVLAVLFVPVYSVSKLKSRLRVNTHYLRLAEQVKRRSADGDRIVVLGRGRPEVIYYSDRRGWHVRKLNRERLEEYLRNGAQYLAVSDIDLLERELEGWLSGHHTLLHRGEEGLIFRLRSSPAAMLPPPPGVTASDA